MEAGNERQLNKMNIRILLALALFVVLYVAPVHKMFIGTASAQSTSEGTTVEAAAKEAMEQAKAMEKEAEEALKNALAMAEKAEASKNANTLLAAAEALKEARAKADAAIEAMEKANALKAAVEVLKEAKTSALAAEKALKESQVMAEAVEDLKEAKAEAAAAEQALKEVKAAATKKSAADDAKVADETKITSDAAPVKGPQQTVDSVIRVRESATPMTGGDGNIKGLIDSLLGGGSNQVTEEVLETTPEELVEEASKPEIEAASKLMDKIFSGIPRKNNEMPKVISTFEEEIKGEAEPDLFERQRTQQRWSPEDVYKMILNGKNHKQPSSETANALMYVTGIGRNNAAADTSPEVLKDGPSEAVQPEAPESAASEALKPVLPEAQEDVPTEPVSQELNETVVELNEEGGQAAESQGTSGQSQEGGALVIEYETPGAPEEKAVPDEKPQQQKSEAGDGNEKSSQEEATNLAAELVKQILPQLLEPLNKEMLAKKEMLNEREIELAQREKDLDNSMQKIGVITQELEEDRAAFLEEVRKEKEAREKAREKARQEEEAARAGEKQLEAERRLAEEKKEKENNKEKAGKEEDEGSVEVKPEDLDTKQLIAALDTENERDRYPYENELVKKVKFGNEDIIPALIEQLEPNNTNLAVKRGCIAVLKASKDQRALTQLKEIYFNGDPETQEMAFLAMKKIDKNSYYAAYFKKNQYNYMLLGIAILVIVLFLIAKHKFAK